MSDRSITSRSGHTLTVRRLCERDAIALRKFHENLSERSRSRFTPHAYDSETIATYVDRNADGDDLIFVIEAGGLEIVGYFFLWEFNTPVPTLGIGLADDWQEQGLGKQMMDILISEARRAGRMGIELTTVPDNERAFRLYQSAGFQDLGLVSNIAGDGRVIIERKMFLPLKDDARPTSRDFKPPA